jgi:hypothetical protein
MKNNIKIHEYDLVSRNILFVDGIPRTGKALLSKFLLGFENISAVQFFSIIEQLFPLYLNKKIDINSFSALIRLYLNENIYNYNISRNLNFRPQDLSSVFNTANPDFYLKNLNKKDGDSIIKEIKSNNNYTYQYQTHDIFTNYNLFEHLNIDVKVIELIRNPISVIHSWYKRGWGERFDKADLRNFTLLFSNNDKYFPHYIDDYNEYQFLNPIEKCVYICIQLYNKIIKQNSKLTSSKKNKVLFIAFEEILVNPEKQGDRISIFLNKQTQSNFNQIKKQINIPRKINQNELEEKKKYIYSKINKHLADQLFDLSKEYELNYLNLIK